MNDNVRFINHNSSRNLSLKLDTMYSTLNFNKNSMIGNPGISLVKIGLIDNKPPLDYNLTNYNKTFYNSNSNINQNETIENSKIKNLKIASSFSAEKELNKDNNKNKYISLFKPLVFQTIKKNSLNENSKINKKRKKKVFNKEYYNGELQNLSNRLFGYNHKKINENMKNLIFGKKEEKEKEEDSFYISNININNDNLIKNREKLLNDAKILSSNYKTSSDYFEKFNY